MSVHSRQKKLGRCDHHSVTAAPPHSRHQKIVLTVLRGCRRHAHIAARHPLIHSAHKFRPPTRRLTARIARFILPRTALFTGALHAMPAWKFFLRLRRRFFISDLTPRRRHFSGVIIVSRRIACIAMPAAPRPIVTPLNHNPPRPKIYHGRADLPIRAARTSFSVVTNFTRLKILPRAIQSGRTGSAKEDGNDGRGVVTFSIDPWLSARPHHVVRRDRCVGRWRACHRAGPPRLRQKRRASRRTFPRCHGPGRDQPTRSREYSARSDRRHVHGWIRCARSGRTRPRKSRRPCFDQFADLCRHRRSAQWPPRND